MALRCLSELELREHRIKSLCIRIIDLVGKTNEKYGTIDGEVKELLANTNELYSVVFQQVDYSALYNLAEQSISSTSNALQNSSYADSESDDSSSSPPFTAIISPNANISLGRPPTFWKQEPDASSRIIDIKDINKQEQTQSQHPKSAFFPPRDFRKKKTRKQRAKAAPETTELFCRSCGETKTCEWRRGPDGYKSLCNACGIHYAKIVKREETQMQTYVPKGPIKMDQLVNNNSSSTNQDNNSSSDAAVTIKGPFSIYPAVASPPLARSMQRDAPQAFMFPVAPSSTFNFTRPTKPPPTK